VGGRQAYLPDMAHKMISNQKVINYEVSQILGIYNFHFGSFFV
jgi:hypothetical protein